MFEIPDKKLSPFARMPDGRRKHQHNCNGSVSWPPDVSKFRRIFCDRFFEICYLNVMASFRPNWRFVAAPEVESMMERNGIPLCVGPVPCS